MTNKELCSQVAYHLKSDTTGASTVGIGLCGILYYTLLKLQKGARHGRYVGL